MIANIKNILKIEDLRNKILFTLMIVGLYRVGAAIRVPGVDPLAIEQLAPVLKMVHSASSTCSPVEPSKASQYLRWESCRTSRRASLCRFSVW